jgi:anti-sigma B factor antagonist
MAAPPAFRCLTVEEVGDATVVEFLDTRITEELNIQTVGDELSQLVVELGRRKVLLDFSNVAFLSSGVLGKLSVLHHTLQAVQGKLVLCGIRPELVSPFKITKLDRTLTLVPDRAAGLQAF